MDITPITIESLPAIIEQEIAGSIGQWDGSLAFERKLEIDYYNGKPFGNEKEGESQVVSTDVSDTIEGMLPDLLEIFTASDDVVRFDPVGLEDEEVCKQQTELSNYIFYKQNNGFLVMYEWFKDALINKNGVVKYYWEEKEEKTTEEYEGLTEGEYRQLLNPNDGSQVKELKKASYNDPDAIAKIDQFRAALPDKAKQLAQGDPAMEREFVRRGTEVINQQQIPQLYDCKVEITKDVSKTCIEAVAPEEFVISAKTKCISIQDTPFCGQYTRKTLTYLRENGCPEEIIDKLGTSMTTDVTPEALARDRFIDIQYRDGQSKDPSMREVWVFDGYIRIDFDGDGISELRHVIMPGREIWINEPAEHICFAAITPVIMPHRWTGRSVAELVMDIQFQNSTLLRQMFNNLYLTNNPRKVVLATAGGIVQANLDDLLVSRSGGVVREYVPNAVRELETPFVAGASFPMIEYLQGVKENRTGVTRYNQGTDADSLNKTARGINQIMAAGQKRLRLIARIFGETGVKDLFRGISYITSKYSQKSTALKLRGTWVDIDPREWKNEFNMTINVGLGTGNQDAQLQHLQMMHADMVELMQAGRGYMVTDENLFNLYSKRAEAMGFKHPELFITDPKRIPPAAKQPRPDPAIVKAQMEQQTNEKKLQFAQWKENANAQLMKEIEVIKGHAAIEVAKVNHASDAILADKNLNHQAQLEIFKQRGALNDSFERWKTELDNATRIAVAQISAQTAEKTATLSAAAKVADQTIIDTTGASAGSIKDAVGAISDGTKSMAETLTAHSKDLAKHMASFGAALQQHAQPKNFSVENLQLGPDGIIKGGTIKKH